MDPAAPSDVPLGTVGVRTDHGSVLVTAARDHSLPTLLYVTPVVPMLSGPGISMRAGQHVQALASMFRVTLAVVGPSPNDLADLPDALRSACDSVIEVSRANYYERLRKRLGPSLLRRLVEAAWPLPGPIASSTEAVKALAEALGPRRFDVVHCFRLQTALLARFMEKHGLECERLVIDVDDYESFARARAAGQLRKTMGTQYAALGWLEARKFSLFEARLIPRFREAYVCSHADRKALSHRFPDVQWHVVPNVVSAPAAVGQRLALGAPFTFLFVGTFDYAPNCDAALYFCREVLPLLRSLMSGPFMVNFVGRNAGRNLAEVGNLPNVSVITNPPDVAPYYATADVVIVPIRAGGGTRIKILEAFSYRLPVVSTTIGAEGLDLTQGYHAEIADGPDQFAEACQRLFHDPNRRAALADAGYGLYSERFSTQALRNIYGRIHAALIGPTSRANLKIV